MKRKKLPKLNGTDGIPSSTKKSNVEPKIVLPTEQGLTHEQLLLALYWMFDAFERSSIGFVLINSTAESALEQRDLEGDKIELAVRRLEWESGSKDLFDTYIQDESIETEIEDNKVRYFVNGVPVEVSILEDDPCISSPDLLQYQNEFFNLPNPYSRFKEVYK